MNKLRFAAIMATVLMASLLPVQAASPITYQYTYDAAGQLTSAIDSTGVVLQYVYDSAARLIQTTRTAPGGPLSVLGVSPASGVAGTAVTIIGSGFSAVAANNVVTFNGVAAVVTAATAKHAYRYGAGDRRDRSHLRHHRRCYCSFAIRFSDSRTATNHWYFHPLPPRRANRRNHQCDRH